MSNNYIASVTLYSSTPFPSLWSGMSSSMTASTTAKLQALNQHQVGSGQHVNSSQAT